MALGKFTSYDSFNSIRSIDGFLWVILLVLGFLVLFPLLMVFAMPMIGWWWGNGIAGGLSPLWGLGVMLGWLVILLGIGYLLYRGLVAGMGTGAVSDPALKELRLAHARGDLSEEEFEIIALYTGSDYCLELMTAYAMTVVVGIIGLAMLLIGGYHHYEETVERVTPHLPAVSAAVQITMGLGFVVGVF